MRPALVLLIAAAIGPLAAAEFFNINAISPVPIGAGARAMGVGGAFAAIADDATASTHNPAGMAQLDLPEIAASFGIYHDQFRQDGGTTQDQTAFALDHLSAIWPFFAGFQQTVGVAWQRQYDFTRAFSESSTSVFVDDSDPGNPTTFSTTIDESFDQRGSFSNIALSWAAELAPTVSVGVTGRVWNDALTGASHYRQDRFIVVNDEISDLLNGSFLATNTSDLHTLVSVDEGYSADFGVLWRALPALNVALTIKPRYRLHLREKTSASVNGAAPASDAPARAIYSYPTSAVVAAAWRIGDQRTIALDLGWTRWSELSIESVGVEGSPLSPVVDTADQEDSYSVRLGGEQLFILPSAVLAVRAGAFYEGLPGLTQAQLSEDARATTEHYFGLAAGLGLGFRHLVYDLAVQWRFANNVGSGVLAASDRSVDINSLNARLGLAWQW